MEVHESPLWRSRSWPVEGMSSLTGAMYIVGRSIEFNIQSSGGGDDEDDSQRQAPAKEYFLAGLKDQEYAPLRIQQNGRLFVQHLDETIHTPDQQQPLR